MYSASGIPVAVAVETVCCHSNQRVRRFNRFDGATRTSPLARSVFQIGAEQTEVCVRQKAVPASPEVGASVGNVTLEQSNGGMGFSAKGANGCAL